MEDDGKGEKCPEGSDLYLINPCQLTCTTIPGTTIAENILRNAI